MIRIRVDHATVCGRELAPLQQAFADAGLATDYGGSHANGVTHMALVGFSDGSYLELIAPQTQGQTEGSPWSKLMTDDAGCCAWAIPADNIQAEVSRLSSLGIETKGPFPGSRQRPDGKVLQWETAKLGPGEPGALLPFLIQDHTPRAWRVQVSESARASALSGISAVVLQVPDMDFAVALFRRAYGWEAPLIEQQQNFGASIAHFPGTPVMLAAPLDASSWLARRLAMFGAIPVAYLLGTHNLAAVEEHLRLSNRAKFCAKDVAWCDLPKSPGIRLGVTEV
jgi:Glyoxalase-like domain